MRPSGRRSRGGSGVYVRAVVGALRDAVTDTAVVAVERDAERRHRHRRGRPRRAASTGSWSPPIPTRRCVCWPIRRRRELRVLSSFDYASNETVLHTDGVAAAAGRAARARRGTTCSSALLDDRDRWSASPTTSTACRRWTSELLRYAEPDRPHAPGSEISRMCTSIPCTRSTRSQAQRPAAHAARGVAQHRVLRRLPRLGIPRGRLPCRACARRWRWGAAGERHLALRGHRSMHTRPPGARAPLPVPLRRLPVADRPRTHRRGCRGCCAPLGTRAAAAITSATPTRSIRAEHRRVPGRARGRSGRRAGAAADQRRARWGTSSTRCRCTGATTGRRTALHRCRGAQHLRPAPLLPAGAGRRTGRVETDKEFYVSPFLTVDGRYRMSLLATGRAAVDPDGADPGRGDGCSRRR